MSYVKLEDVKNAFPFLERHKVYVLEKWWIDKMLDLEVPTVDAVEVVRCKDCKHNYYNMIPSGEADHECAKCVELPITADFYCAWGERGEEERK